MSELVFLRAHGLDLTLRFVAAAACGAAIGWDRRRRGSPAGVKTFLLISVGAASYMAIGHVLLDAASQSGDPTRIAGQIVTGIGFLGAGTILQGRTGVTGLTTAASVWQTGAIGVLIGCGLPLTGMALTALTLLAIHALAAIERRGPPSQCSELARHAPDDSCAGHGH